MPLYFQIHLPMNMVWIRVTRERQRFDQDKRFYSCQWFELIGVPRALEESYDPPPTESSIHPLCVKFTAPGTDRVRRALVQLEGGHKGSKWHRLVHVCSDVM